MMKQGDTDKTADLLDMDTTHPPTTTDEGQANVPQRPSPSPEIRVKFSVTHTRCNSSSSQSPLLLPSSAVARVVPAEAAMSVIRPQSTPPPAAAAAVASFATPPRAAQSSPSSQSLSREANAAVRYNTPPLVPRVAPVPLITPRYQKKTSTHTLINVTDSFPERMTATEALRQQTTETMTIKNGPIEYQQVMHFHTYDLYKLGNRQIHSRSVGYSSDGDLVLTREDYSETSDTDNGFTRKHILISEPTVLNPTARRPLTASEREEQMRTRTAKGATDDGARESVTATAVAESTGRQCHSRAHNKKYPGIFAPRNRKVRNRLLNDHFATEDGRSILQQAREDDDHDENENGSDSGSDSDEGKTSRPTRVRGGGTLPLSSPYPFFRSLPRSLEGSFPIECDVDAAHPPGALGGSSLCSGAGYSSAMRSSYLPRHLPDTAEARWQGLSMRLRAELQHALSSEFLERQIEDLDVLFSDFVQSGPAQESLVFHFKDGYGRLLCHGVAGYYLLNSESRMHVDGLTKLTFVRVPRSRQRNNKKMPHNRHRCWAARGGATMTTSQGPHEMEDGVEVEADPQRHHSCNEVNAVTNSQRGVGVGGDKAASERMTETHSAGLCRHSSLNLPRAPLMRVLRRHRVNEPARHPLSSNNSPQLAPRDLLEHAADAGRCGGGGEGDDDGVVPEVMSPLFLNGSADTSSVANTFPFAASSSSGPSSHTTSRVAPSRHRDGVVKEEERERACASDGGGARIDSAEYTHLESGERGVNVVDGALGDACSSAVEEQTELSLVSASRVRPPTPPPPPQQQQKQKQAQLRPAPREQPLNTTVRWTKNGKVVDDCVPVYVPQLRLSRTLCATETEPSLSSESTQVTAPAVQTTATQRKKMKRAAKAALQASVMN